MPSNCLIGRRVKVTAWYDHEQLIAAHRMATPHRDGPEGTVTHINDFTGRVSVRVDVLDRVYTLPLSDVEVLP
jgi:hypothetical protein